MMYFLSPRPVTGYRKDETWVDVTDREYTSSKSKKTDESDQCKEIIEV